jgi:hypothetical protein
MAHRAAPTLACLGSGTGCQLRGGHWVPGCRPLPQRPSRGGNPLLQAPAAGGVESGVSARQTNTLSCACWLPTPTHCLLGRSLQMGEAGSDVWANLGVACFAAGQHDICLSCFQRALDLAGDCTLPDIWHNIAQVWLWLVRTCERPCFSTRIPSSTRRSRRQGHAALHAAH